MIAESIGGVVFQFFNLLAMHIVINIVGLLFVKAEILRAGDEQLLNDLKEGVIIMDEESGLVLFVNKAAKKFNFKKNENINSRGRKGGKIDIYENGFD